MSVGEGDEKGQWEGREEEGIAIIVWGWMGRTRGSERLSGCVLKRLTPIIPPKREREMKREEGRGREREGETGRG